MASHGFTEARNNLTAIVDAVQKNVPQIIRQRKKSEEDVLMIKTSIVREALSCAGKQRFISAAEREKDGSWTLTLEPFGLAVNGRTMGAAVTVLCRDVRFYAHEFVSQYPLYGKSPNRRKHLSHVLRVLLCTSDAELKILLRIADIS